VQRPAVAGRLAGQAEAPGTWKSSVAEYCEAVMAALVQLPEGKGRHRC
jgi:hypothetical protein